VEQILKEAIFGKLFGPFCHKGDTKTDIYHKQVPQKRTSMSLLKANYQLQRPMSAYGDVQ